MIKLEQILFYLQGAAGTIAAVLPDGTRGDAIAKFAAMMADVARAAISVHNQVNPTDPLDVTKLHEIPQVQ